jgi:hypothetical protein
MKVPVKKYLTVHHADVPAFRENGAPPARIIYPSQRGSDFEHLSFETTYNSMSFQSFPDGLKRMISGYSSIISLAIASPVGSASNPQ